MNNTFCGLLNAIIISKDLECCVENSVQKSTFSTVLTADNGDNFIIHVDVREFMSNALDEVFRKDVFSSFADDLNLVGHFGKHIVRRKTLY